MLAESTDNESPVILLVEDNPAHAELVIRGLEEHPLMNRVYHVTDGEAALNYLFRRDRYADPRESPRPRVILLDLRLPKIDGLEVLKEIKSSEAISSIPVVVLTTSAADRDVTRAYEQHANGYLVKPVDFEQFSRLMAEFGFYWLEWNHYPWT